MSSCNKHQMVILCSHAFFEPFWKEFTRGKISSFKHFKLLTLNGLRHGDFAEF